MQKRKFARTDLSISELCLNANTFGWGPDESPSWALLDACHAAGGRFIQSPGAPSTSGDLVGRWREDRGISRETLVLATCINFRRPTQGGSRAFVDFIREGCENSLRRLRSEYLDLLVCDWDPQLAPVEDLLESVNLLVRAGHVRRAWLTSSPQHP